MPVSLAHEQFGTEGPAIVVLHGLLGSARNWNSVAKRLGEHHRVFTLDLRNHGHSPWADSMAMGAMAADVAMFIDAHELDVPVLIGHSLGGKVAMHLAVTDPARLARLIVVDIAPTDYAHTFLPYVEALRAVDLAAVNRRVDADGQLHDAIGDPVMRSFLLQNLIKTDAGFAWRVNLDALAANMDAMLGFPPPPPGARYERPTLFVAGGRSDYIRPEHHPPIQRLFPAAQHTAIPGAGHWPHAERPQIFLAEVVRFLTAATAG